MVINHIKISSVSPIRKIQIKIMILFVIDQIGKDQKSMKYPV